MFGSLPMRLVGRAALALPEQDRLLLMMALVAAPMRPGVASVLRGVGQMAMRRSDALFDLELNALLQREVSHDDPHSRGPGAR